MQTARIIILALVAILITAGVAVALGTVGREVGAHSHVRLVTVDGTGSLVESTVNNEKYCSYHIPTSVEYYSGQESRASEFLKLDSYRLQNSDDWVDVIPDTDFKLHGKVELGPWSAASIRDGSYANPMPVQGSGNYQWLIRTTQTRHNREVLISYPSLFAGPYREVLHRELLKCAALPTPTPTPIPTATATPEPTATPTPTATLPPAPPPAPPAPAPPGRPGTDPTPTATPSPTPTATPEGGGASGGSGDEPDIEAVLLKLTEALTALIAWLNSQ